MTKHKRTVLSTLKKALRLISRKESWHQGSYAGDKDGFECSLESKSAKRFCALGAVARQCEGGYVSNLFDDTVDELLIDLRKTGSMCGVATYNDSHTHNDVVKLFEKTIKRLEKTA